MSRQGGTQLVRWKTYRRNWIKPTSAGGGGIKIKRNNHRGQIITSPMCHGGIRDETPTDKSILRIILVCLKKLEYSPPQRMGIRVPPWSSVCVFWVVMGDARASEGHAGMNISDSGSPSVAGASGGGDIWGWHIRAEQPQLPCPCRFFTAETSYRLSCT